MCGTRRNGCYRPESRGRPARRNLAISSINVVLALRLSGLLPICDKPQSGAYFIAPIR
jgi:hypothetical protein